MFRNAIRSFAAAAMFAAITASLIVPSVALAAFSSTATKYAMRSTGNVRTIVVADSGATTGNSTSVYLNSPVAIYVEMYPASTTVAAYGFNGDTVTLQYSVDNGTTPFAALATTIACTAACTQGVATPDVKSGYYRAALTGAGTGYAVITNIIAIGSLDPQ